MVDRVQFGVRDAVVGAVLMVIGAAAWRRGGELVPWASAVAAGLAVMTAIAAMALARRPVRPVGAPSRSAAMLRWLVAFPALVLAALADIALRPAVGVTGLAAAAVVLVYWWRSGRGRPVLVLSAAVLAVTGLAPALAWTDPGAPAAMLTVLAMGLSLSILGLAGAASGRAADRPAGASG